MMLHKQFILRQFSRSKKQALVFVLCVVLSIVTLIAVNGFSKSVNIALLKDARQLHAGDIIIHSHYAFSQPILKAVASLQSQGIVQGARIHEFYTVVRAMQNGRLRMVAIVSPANAIACNGLQRSTIRLAWTP